MAIGSLESVPVDIWLDRDSESVGDVFGEYCAAAAAVAEAFFLERFARALGCPLVRVEDWWEGVWEVFAFEFRGVFWVQAFVKVVNVGSCLWCEFVCVGV